MSGGGPRALPAAGREQPITSVLDAVLLEHARRRRATIAWWWGKRGYDRAYGAYCYLCDTMIVTWARRWPMTDKARAAVMQHRTHETRRLGIDASGDATPDDTHQNGRTTDV